MAALVPKTSVRHAKAFLRQRGFSKEKLAAMDDESVIANMIDQYRQKQRVLERSLPLFTKGRWMIYLTPLRWGWDHYDMDSWVMMHKGPLFIMYFPDL